MNVRLLFLAISLSFVACNNSSRKTDRTDDSAITDSDALAKQEVDSQSTSVLLDTNILAQQREPEQLVTKHILTTNDLYRDYDNGSDLSKFFKIELISKDTFLTHLSTAINYMIYDSIAIIKTDGVLNLPTEHGYLSLKDKIADNETHREYKYIGQLKKLDMYVVQAAFWEDWEFILYDKKNGRRVQSFIGQPYVSGNLQHLICLEIDSFEGVANINMYGITSDRTTNRKYIDPIVEIYIKSWVPYTEQYPMFWGADGLFYVPVIYSSNFVDANNNFYGLDQYIRITPLTS